MQKLFFTFTACNRFRETTTTSTPLYKNFMVWESFFTLADPFPTSIKSSHTTAKSTRMVANARGAEELSHYSPKGDNTSRLRSVHATATERWLITFPKLITAKILSTTRPVTDVAVHHANGTRILHLRAAGRAGNDIFLTILLRKFAIRPLPNRPLHDLSFDSLQKCSFATSQPAWCGTDDRATVRHFDGMKTTFQSTFIPSRKPSLLLALLQFMNQVLPNLIYADAIWCFNVLRPNPAGIGTEKRRRCCNHPPHALHRSCKLLRERIVVPFGSVRSAVLRRSVR